MKLLKPSRRLFIAQALAAPALITCPRIVEAFWQSRDSNYNQSIATAPPSGSVWGDHGTNVALSTTAIANDTATGLANSFTSVRGTQAYSAGKRYFEIKFIAAPAVANFIIGIMDNTTANGAAMDDRLLANSTGHLMFNGTVQGNTWNGVNLGAPFTPVDNDYMGVPVDFDAAAPGDGFYYLSLNGTYFLSGDPTSGAAGTGHVGNGGFPGARPMLSLWGTTVNSGKVQLITGSSINPAHIPSGYSAWG